MAPVARQGHGWWPYVAPYLAFMGTVEVVRRLPDEWAPIGLLLKPAVPGVLMLYYFSRGAYPELRGVALASARERYGTYLSTRSDSRWNRTSIH